MEEALGLVKGPWIFAVLRVFVVALGCRVAIVSVVTISRFLCQPHTLNTASKLGDSGYAPTTGSRNDSHEAAPLFIHRNSWMLVIGPRRRRPSPEC